MTTQEPRYFAYMLRLWRARDHDEMVWRASVEDAHTGERRGFASLEMLFEFLREQTQIAPAPKGFQSDVQVQ